MKLNAVIWFRENSILAVLLALLGLLLFFLLPKALADYRARALAIQSDLISAFSVRDGSNEDIGWLEITYPQTMKVDQESKIEIVYKSQGRAWNSSGSILLSQPARVDVARLDQLPKLSVQLSATGLDLSPTPLAYMFNSRTITASESDGDQWIVSPKRPGDYFILVKFAVEPRDWHIGAVAENGTATDSQFGSIPLSVHVENLWYLSDLEIAAFKGCSQFFSFILTLPLLAIIIDPYLKRWLRRKRATGGPGK